MTGYLVKMSERKKSFSLKHMSSNWWLGGGGGGDRSMSTILILTNFSRSKWSKNLIMAAKTLRFLHGLS